MISFGIFTQPNTCVLRKLVLYTITIVTITIMHLVTAVIIITEMTRTIHSLVIWNSLTAVRYVRASLR